MSERGPLAAADSLKFGLLMESAQAHQKMAENHLDELRAHTRGLDGVVREEIRRTLIDELRELTAECDRTARALRDMKHSVTRRSVLWNVTLVILCTGIPSAIAHYALPSPKEISALRVERDSLSKNLARLEQRGGKVEWRSCGDSARLCVRIDRGSPVYGTQADYYIVKGY